MSAGSSATQSVQVEVDRDNQGLVIAVSPARFAHFVDQAITSPAIELGPLNQAAGRSAESNADP